MTCASLLNGRLEKAKDIRKGIGKLKILSGGLKATKARNWAIRPASLPLISYIIIQTDLLFLLHLVDQTTLTSLYALYIACVESLHIADLDHGHE